MAPLAYVGVGLLLVLSRMEPAGSDAWRRWVLLLAFGGFAGNFGLSLLDHAQNGFFRASEWVPVISAAFGSSFLLMAAIRPSDAPLRRAAIVVLAIQCAVGLAGFVLHLDAIVHRPGPHLMERLLYGAPAFAPLLFVDLSVLAAIALWTPRAEPSA